MPLISTAGDLIIFALRTAGITGVGQTPAAEDSNTGLQLLSNIIAEWQRRRWLVWNLVETVLVSTGAASYTVAPAGNFAIARPDRLEAAFVRLLNNTGANQVDYPLAIISSREDYNRIALKSLTAWPVAVFYDSAFPVGVLRFWPIAAAAAYEFHIHTKAALPVYTALTTSLGLPPEYLSAALYTLAVELAMNYGQTPQPALVGKMREAINVIRMANTQVPELRMPSGLAGGRRGGSVSADVNVNFLTGSW